MSTRQSEVGPSICFVALKAYPAVSGRVEAGQIGGAEVQQTLIARELAGRGHRVCFVTQDHGQPDGIDHEGIRVFKAWAADDGLPALRFVHPRWTSLWRAMSRADADVYYQRTAGYETGQCALWCRVRGRPFVFAAASDLDCDRALPYLDTARERALYRYGLKRTSRVIVQSAAQAEQMRAGFAIPSVLIRSCSSDPAAGRAVLREGPPPGRPRVLWVGRFAPVKRFEWLLDLAQARPELSFDVLGGIPWSPVPGAGTNHSTSPYASALVSRAAALPNVELRGQVTPAEVGQFCDAATVLVCTSVVEGFPNTFLEAWSRGVPTVGTVDPDRVVSTGGLGRVGTTLAELGESLDRLVQDRPLWTACSRRAREHYLAFHTVAAAGDAYQALLTEVIAAGHPHVAGQPRSRPVEEQPGG